MGNDLLIRDAFLTDLDGMAGCAERFFEYARYAEGGMPLVKDDFKNMVAEYIESKDGVVLVIVDGLYVAGGIAGMAHRWGFNNSIKMAIELFYWVDENYRGIKSIKLLKEYEKRMTKIGVSVNMMVSPNTHLEEKVENLYKKMGYVDFERFHKKIL